MSTRKDFNYRIQVFDGRGYETLAFSKGQYCFQIVNDMERQRKNEIFRIMHDSHESDYKVVYQTDWTQEKKIKNRH